MPRGHTRTRSVHESLAVVALLIVTVLVAAARADDRVQAVIDQAIGDARSGADRAVRLCQAAEGVSDDGMKTAMLEKAVEYGMQRGQTALSRALVDGAFETLLALHPDHTQAYHVQRVDFHRLSYTTAEFREKTAAGALYVDALKAAARFYDDAKAWTEARAAHQALAVVAKRMNMHVLVEQAIADADRALEMEKARRKADMLAGNLEDRTSNAKANLSMIKVLVIDLDEPGEAAGYVTDQTPEPWLTFVPLLAGTAQASGRAQCKQVADWICKELMPQAEEFARLALEVRAESWYRRVVTDEDDDLTLQARVMLQLIASAQAQRAATPGKFLKSFIAQRDKLRGEKQADFIKQALSELNYGAKIEMTTTIVDHRIVEIQIMCPELENIAPLVGLPLHTLSLSAAIGRGCPRLTDVRVIRTLPLKSLSLSAPNLTSLKPLAGMQLEELTLGDCGSLRTLEGLEGMPLKSLYLQLTNLESLAPLKGCPIESLRLIQTEKLATLKGVEKAPLTSLEIYRCPALTSFAELMDAPLTKLNVLNCGVTNLTGLENAPLTGGVLIGSCPDLVSVKALTGNSTATSLALTNCPKLTSLAGIENMPLKELKIPGCTGLPAEEIARVRKLAATRKFELGL